MDISKLMISETSFFMKTGKFLCYFNKEKQNDRNGIEDFII